ncbi:hypothetical protein M8J77_023500 [Diaphorina citri]|nr:hypothetical protein M8J77_023500 [Diaphorina citri]
MTDNLPTERSFRNHCDIVFIKDNFRFKERSPVRTEYWKVISFVIVVVLFFLVNLKIRIHGAKLKYSKSYVDSFVFSYNDNDRRTCSEFEDKSRSMYLFFKTLSHDFHKRPGTKDNESLARVIAQEGVQGPFKGSKETDEAANDNVGSTKENTGSSKDTSDGKNNMATEREIKMAGASARTIKRLVKGSEESIEEFLMPAVIILLLMALTAKTIWDVTGDNNVTKKKPSISSLSRRPSLRQNLLRRMSETNMAGHRRPSYSRQNSQPDLRRKMSMVKEVSSGDLTRQCSAPASYMTPTDGLKRGYALDYSSCEDDQNSPESKRRIRMIRRSNLLQVDYWKKSQVVSSRREGLNDQAAEFVIAWHTGIKYVPAQDPEAPLRRTAGEMDTVEEMSSVIT